MTITNNEQYQAALNRVLEILPDTDNPELVMLSAAIKAYEEGRFPVPNVSYLRKVNAMRSQMNGATDYRSEEEIFNDIS